jgi:hypothetical protein
MFKSRMMIWAEDVERMGETRYRIVVGKPEEITRKTKTQVGG